jgi:hypothetical protein
MSDHPRAAIRDQLSERRADAGFRDRLRASMERDQIILDRLRGHCGREPLRLVESHHGGAVLLYECPVCHARMARTKEQAESDAVPANPLPEGQQ